MGDTVMISDRPAEVKDRAVPWATRRAICCSAGAPLGSRPSSERTSRYTQLVALPDGRKAEPVRAALAQSIASLPSQLRRSLTWDQGKEMTEHALFTVDSGVQVYFCDPNSPWQRGTNENTNGLLRQYLPARTDRAGISQVQLDAIAADPRGWLCACLDLASASRCLDEVKRGDVGEDPAHRLGLVKGAVRVMPEEPRMCPWISANADAWRASIVRIEIAALT